MMMTSEAFQRVLGSYLAPRTVLSSQGLKLCSSLSFSKPRDPFESRLKRMIKTGTDSRTIQQTIDRVAERVPASFILLRFISFGHTESTISVWTPKDDRAPLSIDLPVSNTERAVISSQRPVFIEDAEREASDDLLRTLVERLGARSVYFSPVIYDNQVIASIGLISTDAPRHW